MRTFSLSLSQGEISRGGVPAKPHGMEREEDQTDSNTIPCMTASAVVGIPRKQKAVSFQLLG